MYLPENEIERIARNMIIEFGDDAEQASRRYAVSARERGLGPIALIWQHVLERIVQLRDDATLDSIKAA